MGAVDTIYVKGSNSAGGGYFLAIFILKAYKPSTASKLSLNYLLFQLFRSMFIIVTTLKIFLWLMCYIESKRENAVEHLIMCLFL